MRVAAGHAVADPWEGSRPSAARLGHSRGIRARKPVASKAHRGDLGPNGEAQKPETRGQRLTPGQSDGSVRRGGVFLGGSSVAAGPGGAVLGAGGVRALSRVGIQT